MISKLKIYGREKIEFPEKKLLINTINAHSYNIFQEDPVFEKSLSRCDILLPDGVSIVWAVRFLTGRKITKIAGEDLFFYEMKRLEKRIPDVGTSRKVFFLGSDETTLKMIESRSAKDFPNVKIKTYSPSYTKQFSDEENRKIVGAINSFSPDVLFVGMTAPKQEKWAFTHFKHLKAGHVCCVGAVFDFYAGTIRRAPGWMIMLGLEWFYRLASEPKRMWRRYLIGNLKFFRAILIEKLRQSRE